ncbi:hypothetical protein EK599_13180 [Vibrio sp. T187]|uniref:hypothetical protein n=1 Tax=Vibrio TaxID=662 RepID=UPI0010C94595|nr:MULTISPECIES: hypothetical protein [Vibrio]MBW3696651.1 hypothetical protein [Vibrio sp. T187]
MTILITFACFVIPVALVIGFHQLIASAVMPSVQRSYLGKAIYYVSAAVGTPIHELSHAFMALLFRHKIHKVSLFQFGADGRLGYVSHTWNKTSLYQSIGVFFIAIAPIAGAAFILYLSSVLLGFSTQSFSYISHRDGIVEVLVHLADNFMAILGIAFNDLPTLLWYLVISLVCFHCIPSRSDFNNALKGSIIVILVVSVILMGFEFANWQFGISLFFEAWSVSITWLSLVVISSLLWWVILAITSLI